MGQSVTKLRIATFSFHAGVLLLLQTLFRGMVASESIEAMTLRLIVWAVILGLMLFGSRKRASAEATDHGQVLRPR